MNGPDLRKHNKAIDEKIILSHNQRRSNQAPQHFMTNISPLVLSFKWIFQDVQLSVRQNTNAAMATENRQTEFKLNSVGSFETFLSTLRPFQFNYQEFQRPLLHNTDILCCLHRVL